MRTIEETALLRERAIALRLAGKSRREIKEILGPMSNSTLNDALQGAPPPDWTRRPNAKDDVRARARDLRAEGLDYNEIAARLGVSKSSAQRFWEGVTGAPSSQFGSPTLKRHNPKTNRKNIDDAYHGCLRLEVRRSRELYRKIEGWVCGIAGSSVLSAA
jgi:hypothetical protein